MKKNVINITEKDLRNIVNECVSNIHQKTLNEEQIDEVFGLNHGLRGAIRSAANGGKMWNGFKGGVKDYYTAKKRAKNINSIRKNRTHDAEDSEYYRPELDNIQSQSNNQQQNVQPQQSTTQQQGIKLCQQAATALNNKDYPSVQRIIYQLYQILSQNNA